MIIFFKQCAHWVLCSCGFVNGVTVRSTNAYNYNVNHEKRRTKRITSTALNELYVTGILLNNFALFVIKAKSNFYDCKNKCDYQLMV